MGRIFVAFILGILAHKNQDSLKSYGKEIGSKALDAFDNTFCKEGD